MVIVFAYFAQTITQFKCGVYSDAAANIRPFHMVRPIPQAQLDAVANKGEFTQNEGYL